jgi:hypothetical protein
VTLVRQALFHQLEQEFRRPSPTNSQGSDTGQTPSGHEGSDPGQTPDD